MKSSKKKVLTVTLGAILMVVTIGITYAFVSQILTGSKEVVVSAGVLDLVLEEENAITISDALPMYDQVGMIQEDVFVFRLVNKTSNPTDYMLKLSKIEADNELSTDDVKYYLTKEGVGEPKLLSTLPTDGTVDSGTITGNDTIDYTLRLWIDSAVTDDDAIDGKTLSYRINAEASQKIQKLTTTIAGKNFEIEESTSTFPNFAEISSATNGRGIYKYTEDGEDIYYWRGNIDAVATEENGIGNHVIFDGYCWEMVRTTKTGGVKMIYDGVPVEADGKQTCPNTGTASQLASKSSFNDSHEDNAYVGYMYGVTGVPAEPPTAQCIKKNSTGTAIEVGTETSEVECTQAGGKWLTTAYEFTHANIFNSTIKGVIDTWFSTSTLNTEENLEKIEDTVYCNDRRIDTTYKTALGYATNETSYMAANRFSINSTSIPDLSCSKNDSFTVKEENGNGDLTYPVGLLTLDEMVLAGAHVNASSNNDYYLYTGCNYWTLTPVYFDGKSAIGLNVYKNGRLDISGVYYNMYGVRPVVSLAAGTTFADGTNGTESNPYVVE